MSSEDPASLVKFYEKVFGWKFYKWEGDFDYWMINTGNEDEPGINGGLGRSDEENPAGTVNVIDITDIDNAIRDIKAAGGNIVRDKGAIPGIGWFALFKDPQGLIFGLMQSDETVGLDG